MTHRITGPALAAAATALAAAACGGLGETVSCSSYITSYYAASELSLTVEEAAVGGEPFWLVRVNAGRVTKVCDAFDASDTGTRLLDSLSRANRDTAWPEGTAHEYDRHFALARDLAALHITAISDWDDAHPRGSSLDDIATCAALSAARLIDSGYAAYDWSTLPADSPVRTAFPGQCGSTDRHPLCMKLTEMEAPDFRLLWGEAFTICALLLPQRADESAGAALKVTAALSDGTPLSRSTVTKL